MKKLLLLLIIPFLSFGQCVGDCDNGQGKYTWKESGDWFDGEWKDREFLKGKYYWKESGDWFDGEWKDGSYMNGTEVQNHTGGNRCYITLENGRKIKISCDNENKYNSDDISGPMSMRINLINNEDKSDAFFINLVINNQKIRFLFDTGATDFVVSLSQWNKMKKAGLKYEYLNITSEAEVVGGSITTKYYKIFDPLQIGDFKIKNIIIAVCQSCEPDEIEADNLIGIGFFKKFSDVEWSMNKNTLTLYK